MRSRDLDGPVPGRRQGFIGLRRRADGEDPIVRVRRSKVSIGLPSRYSFA